MKLGKVCHRGLTLVEILVTVGIIAILLALLLPVLINSKRQAKATDNLGKLHQLGLAATMYHESSGSWPLSVVSLVENTLIQKEYCQLFNDPTPHGLGNAVAEEREKIPPIPTNSLQVDYRNSIVGLREFRMNDKVFQQWIEPGPAGGWALDMTDASKSQLKNWESVEGRYRRLCFDGSVQTRRFADLDCDYKGTPSPCRMSVSFFVDATTEFKEWVKRL